MMTDSQQGRNRGRRTFRGPLVYGARWIGSFRGWWIDRAAIMQLAAEEPVRRDATIQALIDRGTASQPLLVRALRANPLVACGAAEALAKLGLEIGIQTVLVRSYDEEWLSEVPFRTLILTALRRFDQTNIGSAFQAGLASAPAQRDLHHCFDRLTLSLSALRLLLEYGAASPLAWWEQGARFGHASLPKIRDHPFAGLAYSLTDRIRAVALRGMLTQYPSDAFGVCLRALNSNELAVMRTAVAGMRRLKDCRALPHLQPIAFSGHHPLAPETRKAIESIAGVEAESLTLLRGSHTGADVRLPEELVRPADYGPTGNATELLRPSGR